MKEMFQHDPLTREQERELIRKYKAGDREAGNQLVLSNIRLVAKIAREYAGESDFSDFVQEGCLGLIEALNHFDPEMDVRFTTYAVHWIRAYMHKYLLKTWSLVKVGTNELQKKIFYRMGKIDDEDTSIEKLAQELQTDEETLKKELSRLTSRDFYLSSPVSSEDDAVFQDFIPDSGPDQEEISARKEEIEFVREALKEAASQMSEREKLILEKRLLASEPLTLQEIGRRLGVSRERARQIEEQVLSKIQKALREKISRETKKEVQK